MPIFIFFDVVFKEPFLLTYYCITMVEGDYALGLPTQYVCVLSSWVLLEL